MPSRIRSPASNGQTNRIGGNSNSMKIMRSKIVVPSVAGRPVRTLQGFARYGKSMIRQGNQL